MPIADMSNNPLLAADGLPRFDAIKAEHVVPAVDAMIAHGERVITQVEQVKNPTWDSVMRPLEILSDEIHRVTGPVGHLKGVQDTEEMRAAWEIAEPKVIAFGLRMNQSKPIYAAMQQLIKDPSLSPVQVRILKQSIQDAELSGIGLPDDKRAKFNKNQEELAELQTTFSNHVLDSTKKFELIVTDKQQVAGIPADILEMAAKSMNQVNPTAAATAENGPWRLTLNPAIYAAVMMHCQDRSVREKIYRGYNARASEGELDNLPVIEKILLLRKEQANLLGYETYANLSIAKKMAPSVEAVHELLGSLKEASFVTAKKEFAEIEALAREMGMDQPLSHWDVGFYSQRLKEKLFNYKEEEIKPYFQHPKVLASLFKLTELLFDVRVKEAANQPPVWHPDVRYYTIESRDGQPIAGFYLDPYARPGSKRAGAWMDDCTNRWKKPNGKTELPVAYLVCNGAPPVNGKPALMTFGEVTTLFHEFGHGLQHMLTTVDKLGASGIQGIEWDAVELPSQFMENWCYHKPTLMGMTAHVETGEKLPGHYFAKIEGAKNFREASSMLVQIRQSLIDLELHENFVPQNSKSALELAQKISKNTAILQPLPEDRFICGFSHIFAGGYSAGYYSYKWAEVLSADAFQAFEEAGLDDLEAIRATGQRFRDTILSLGGGTHPMAVFKLFRGREPKVDALLLHSGLKQR